MSFTLLSLNVEGSKHLTERVWPFLRRLQPEVCCFQEFPQSRLAATAEILKAQFYFVPAIKVASQSRFYPKPDQFGVAIFVAKELTANPIFHHQYYHAGVGEILANTLLPPPLYQDIKNVDHRMVVWVELSELPTPLTIATTHFTWAGKGGSNQRQRADLRRLESILTSVQPDIFCGDFNAPRGGEIFARLGRLMIDHVPPSATTTIDQQLHRRPGLQLVVDGFFAKTARLVKKVELIDSVSDHLALVGQVSQ